VRCASFQCLRLSDSAHLAQVFLSRMETEIVENKVFTPSVGLTTYEADMLLHQWGRNELPEHHKSHVRTLPSSKYIYVI